MNDINNDCLKRYKPDDEGFTVFAKNFPYNPEDKYSEEKMAKHNPGSLPPNELNLKIGCYLMLLRNWRVHEGLVNGTRLRLLEVIRKKRVLKCEILTGPRMKKPVVT